MMSCLDFVSMSSQSSSNTFKSGGSPLLDLWEDLKVIFIERGKYRACELRV